jgi:ribulose-5-phosphate 4-epimerase/fuculose-1-phosphate aldolase
MPAAIESHADLIAQLTKIAQLSWQRGWTRAGSCSYSGVLNHQPLQLLTTTSSTCRSALVPSDFSIVDDVAISDALTAPGSNQADAAIHGWIAKHRNSDVTPANAILQTQSVWSGLLADRFNTLDGVLLEDHQLLSILAGRPSEKAAHAVWLPIIPRGKDSAEQLTLIEKALQFQPSDCLPPTAMIIQHHSLFTWATDIATAYRQVEIFEYFCEYLVRKAAIS